MVYFVNYLFQKIQFSSLKPGLEPVTVSQVFIGSSILKELFKSKRGEGTSSCPLIFMDHRFIRKCLNKVNFNAVKTWALTNYRLCMG